MEKTKPPYSVFSNVWFMMKAAWHSYKQIIVLCVLFALFDLMSSVVQLFATPTILEKIQTGPSAMMLLKTIFLFVGLLFFANAGKTYTRDNGIFGKAVLRSSFMQAMNDKYAETSLPNAEDPEYIALGSRVLPVVYNNNSGAEAIWSTLGNILRDSFGLIIYWIVLAEMPVVLMLIILATTIVSFLISRHVQGWEYKHKEEQARLDKKAGYLRGKPSDPVLGKDVRIFGMQPMLGRIHDKVMDSLKTFQRQKQKRLFFGNATEVMAAVLRNGAAYYYLTRLVVDQKITVPMFLLYFGAFTGLTQWVSGLLKDFVELHKQSLDLSMLREYLDHPEPFLMDEGEEIYPEDIPYTIKLEHVSFRYPGAEEDAISDIDLTLHDGDKVAIVGVNGAGKTTLIKLLCGFEDPTEGQVLLNGKDVRRYNRRQYYTLFTAVFQQFTTLGISIEENIAMKTFDIDEERIEDSLKKADLWEKVQSFPKKEKTPLSKEIYEDGVSLSGGEMQRLILARALYRSAPILILDEPTAALDPIAEDQMYQRYYEMTKGKISVFISHRLASTRFCDRILMMEKGKIIETGTHEELLNKQGAYAQLFEVQSRYYRSEGEEDDHA